MNCIVGILSSGLFLLVVVMVGSNNNNGLVASPFILLFYSVGSIIHGEIS